MTRSDPTESAPPCTVDGRDDAPAQCEELKRLREQLHRVQRLGSIGTMASMILHELNNILTPLVNYAQMATKRPELKDKAVAKALSCGQRASTICQAVLGIARGRENDGERFALRDLVDDTISAMVRDPEKDGITLFRQINNDLTLTLPRMELQQVLLNLLINARSAVLECPTPRNIDIHANADGDTIQLRIADNGPGIPEELREKIFEPFFTTKAQCNGQGSGLGLAICREIITSMSGHIEVQSPPGGGAEFIITLPRD